MNYKKYNLKEWTLQNCSEASLIFFNSLHKMSIPKWKLMQVLTWFYLWRTCACFRRNSWSYFLCFSALSSSHLSLAASGSRKLLSALADTPQRTQTLYQTLQIHQKWFSSFYLPLRWPTNGALTSLFHRIPLYLKEQHGNRKNFNRLHKHYSQERIWKISQFAHLMILSMSIQTKQLQ